MFDSSRPQGYNGSAVPEYELIDHTADLGITVRAPQLHALFACAAHALFDLTCDLQQVSSGMTIRVALGSDDLEGLMVAWLNELIFYHETQRLLLKFFDVRISGSYQLAASAQGEILDPRRHEIFRSIKAATYHQLEIRRLAGGIWTASIIFDV